MNKNYFVVKIVFLPEYLCLFVKYYSCCVFFLSDVFVFPKKRRNLHGLLKKHQNKNVKAFKLKRQGVLIEMTKRFFRRLNALKTTYTLYK